MVRIAIRDHVFPAASIAVTKAGKVLARKGFGTFRYAHEQCQDFDFPNTPVTPATLFDLASVTKAVATTTMAMLLYERGLLELDAPIIGTVPEFLIDSTGNSGPRRHEVTFRMLLAHSSGLPAYEKLFLKARSREELLAAALTVPLSADPGTLAEYSDIGFIILGLAVERLAQEKLEAFCQREIFGPLAMTNTTFNPAQDLRTKVPPTADEREALCGADAPVRERRKRDPQPSASHPKPHSTFRNRIIQGEVQDENASVLGGVAGHAGLFATAEDVAKFAHAMLQGGSPILHPVTFSVFTRRDTTPGTSRALGWDTPSRPSQSGKYFGPNSYGHLGYTGTSLWIDPERNLFVILLTNRVNPTRENEKIRKVRPALHDAVFESLGLVKPPVAAR